MSTAQDRGESRFLYLLISLGALVVVEENDRELTFLLAPFGGGIALCQGTVQVVTTKSPLGRSLLGKRAGDD